MKNIKRIEINLYFTHSPLFCVDKYISLNILNNSLNKLENRLILGFFSFVFPEVFAGSSPIYILEFWVYIVTFPLYLIHFLLLISLAIKFNRTSLKNLYLWGIVFGLYETWITKVIWAGYGDDGFALGSIAGFGIHETIVLILFWHPFFAFILPLAVFWFLFGDRETSKIFSGLDSIFLGSKRNKYIFWLFVISNATVTISFNTQNLVGLLGTTIPTLIILSIIIKRKRNSNFSDEEFYEILNLKRKSFTSVIMLTIFLYIVTFTQLRPGLIPGITQILITIAIYLLILISIYFNKNTMTFNNIETIGQIEYLRKSSLYNMFFFLIGSLILQLLNFVIPILWLIFVLFAILQVPFSIFLAISILTRRYLFLYPNEI
jgi:hypothetical protein